MQLPETIDAPSGLTVVGADADLLRQLLGELDNALRGVGFPVDRFMRPGTSEARVRREVAAVRLNAPDELVAWFVWHDGRSDTEESRYFLPSFTLWPLSEVIASYVDPEYEPHGSEEWEWDPRWLHILGPNVGLAMRCDGDPAVPPLIRNVASDSEFTTQPDQTGRQVVSMCTPVSWWIDSLRAGLYVWDTSVRRWFSDETMQPNVRVRMGMI